MREQQDHFWQDELDGILGKAMRGAELSDQDLLFLLRYGPEAADEVFAAARALREKHFGNRLFLYGFVYFSTYCRNDCSFCFYRRSNGRSERYRKTEEEILETAKALRASGVHLIDLTMGEDEYFLRDGARLAGLVRTLKENCGDIPVMVSPGVADDRTIAELAGAGADWYALYQETHDRKTFAALRIGQDYDERMHAKQTAFREGMLLEEGLLSGIGESPEDIVQSLRVMKELKISQGRSMTFIPQDGTPMEKRQRADFGTELLNIAVMRLYMPDILIPASLDVDGIRGLKERLMAGANVVTSIIPPRKGFAGVANAHTDVDEGYRTVDGIRDVVKECGLETASPEEYKAWVTERKNRQKSIS